MAAVPEALPPAPPVTSAEERYPVEFTARAGEYFRIWIVNLALTVLTLGIYSAWAKVRKKRYFYAHALVAGEGFEYRGNPVAILKGRILAVAVFLLYGALGHVSLSLQLALGLALAIAFPWLLVRSLAFNAHNTAYRNVRFHFDGKYAAALKLFAGCAALVVITLGFAYPYAQARLTQFTADHHRYGTARFTLPRLTGKFYFIYLCFAALLALLIGFLFLFSLMIAVLAGLGGVNPRAAGLVTILLAGSMSIGLMAFYLVGFAYLRTRFANAIWNHLRMGGEAVRFESRLRARDFALLYLVNIFAIVLTLGLATPWAVVRTLRYRAQKTAVIVAGGLDQFVAEHSSEVSASGEEVGEMFGFDFGF
jgi:uncharacterized membrane protein YjgN (DUF898 family)